MKESIKVKGLNELEKKILKAIDKNLKLKVGVLGNQNSDMVMIAAVQEFGARINVTKKMRYFLGFTGLWLKKSTEFITIPERSFMRSVFKEKKFNILKGIKENINKVIAGIYTQDIFMERLGAAIKLFIQEKINSNIEPENHPYTTMIKGTSKTLIGKKNELSKSIDYEVTTK